MLSHSEKKLKYLYSELISKINIFFLKSAETL